MVSATRFEHLSTWVVVPTTTSPHARPGLLHPAVDWGDGESTVLCEAVRAVDPQLRLAEQVGYLGVEEMQAIDRGLAALLDLNPPSF
jgi:mRNA-degrading endonuclease toxin of MazEF toxin-antitoxin module